MPVTEKQKRAVVIYAIVVLAVNVALAAGQFADRFSWSAIGIAVGINPIANLVLGVLAAIGVVWMADKEWRTRCLVIVAFFTIMTAFSQAYIPFMLWTLWKWLTR